MRVVAIVSLSLLALCGTLCQRVNAAPPTVTDKILVLAAASTTDALNEARTAFEKLHPAYQARISYGASSTLAAQITSGAPADVFLSASTELATQLSKQGLVARELDLLGNQLVIVVPADSKLAITSLEDLAKPEVRHLALADPKSVPAGVYAREALEKRELWKRLADKVTGAADVRQALHFVETGAAEAGIVYATDALVAPRVKVVAHVDPKLTRPIRYPLVLLKTGEGNPAAVQFYNYLSSKYALAIFRKYGFLAVDASERPQP